jgi:arginine repressor
LSEAVGTIGGDDTILVVARDARRAAALARRFERFAGR